MVGFEFGYFLGALGVAALVAGLVMALDRKVGNFGRSIQFLVVGGTLLSFALLVGFGYVERVAEWTLTLLVFDLLFLTGVGSASE